MQRASRLGRAEELVLLLSADCNLRCTYCYQDAKRPGAMGWLALRAALDLLLASPRDSRTISFAGGEPTLEFGLVRRAVDHVAQHARAGRSVSFHLVTNGLLLLRHDIAFLAGHDFRLDLSFDGVGPAQDVRARRTFARLDALLGALRRLHPGYFERRVAVSVTVARKTIPHLADSFAYFLSKDVRDVAVQPAMAQEEWGEEDLLALDAGLSRIVRLSLEHYRAAHRVPFVPFRRATPRSRRGHARTWGCSAPLGQALAVDVDGQVYPCALLARSSQAFPRGIDDRVQALSLGDVRNPALPERLASLSDACRASGLFEPKRTQHSGERQCATCRERARCIICPVARVKRTPADDVNDIPRYLCAYERILGKHRRRFIAQAPPSPGEELLTRLLAERQSNRQVAESQSRIRQDRRFTSAPSRSRLRPAAR